jgi:hypothetical protein
MQIPDPIIAASTLSVLGALGQEPPGFALVS